MIPGGVRAFLEKDLEVFFETISEEDLILLREWLHECDPTAEWPIEERLPRMRARVMAAVMAADGDGAASTRTERE